MEFDWDGANEGHIARHGVSPEEAEEAILDPNRVPADAHRGPAGERRGALVGQTEGGRHLFVTFVLRSASLRVVTARDATATEKRRYRR